MNEQTIFTAAMERPPGGRPAFLEEACGADQQLRLRVEKLLRFHDDAGSFLESPAPELDPTGDHPVTERPGDTIGPYRLLEQIGEGGFGVVYMAEQVKPVRRRVALKIIKPGMDTKDVIARFEAERQALALMDHPHIAKVLDAGATDTSRPYFVMELVKGIPITDYCDQCNLPTRERLELFLPVCQAVQHAHQKGIIHRDLKPTNVLVAMQDGRLAPKIIDFGVAKAINQRLTEHTLVTAFAQMVGTPLYMSPEQAEMSPLEVDTRTDIYSLGVLLYELLTGTTPFEKNRLKEASFDELRRIIREEEPPKPSTRLCTLDAAALSTAAEHRRMEPKKMAQLVRGDLDWIVMKCLEKDRNRRYETANGIVRDIERFLNEEPVEARPPSAAYLLRKFARRNQTALTATAVVLVTAVVGMAVSTVLIAQQRDAAQEAAERANKSAARESQAANQARIAASEARRERQQALRARDLALENLYFSHTHLAHQDWYAGHIGRMHQMIDAHIPSSDEPDLRGWEWYYLLSLCHRDQQTFRGHTSGVTAVCTSPDDQRVASGSQDHTVRIWDLKTSREITVLYGHEDRVLDVSWSPDGRYIASGDDAGKVILWDVATGGQRKVLTYGQSVYAVTWSPDGQRIAAGGTAADLPQKANGTAVGDGTVIIWDTNSGEVVHTLFGGVGSMVRSIAWSPDGRYLLSGESFKGDLHIWETSTGKLVTAISAHRHYIGSVSWSTDGRQFASGSPDQTIKVWEAETWKNVLSISEAHRGIVTSLSWGADSKQLASAGEDGLVKIWDVMTGKQVAVLRGHQGSVSSVCWSESGRNVISGSSDRTIKLWDPTAQPEAREIEAQQRVAWSPDSRLLAARRIDQGDATAIDVLEASTGRTMFSLPYDGRHWVGSIAWSPDGQRLAAALADPGKVVVWDLATRQAILNVAAHDEEARSVAWRPDSRLLASGGWDGLVHLWNVDAQQKVFTFREHEGHEGPVGSVLWSPDGERIASANWYKVVRIWEPQTGRVIHNWRRPNWIADGQYSISWSPTGDRLAAGCSNGDIIVWDTSTGREVLVTRGHTSHIRAVAWSPDGKRLASGGYDRFVKIWDAESGREMLSLPGHKQIISTVAWSPDGRQLATGDWEIKIWDASVGYKLAAESAKK